MTARFSPSTPPDFRGRSRGRYELIGSTGISVTVTVMSPTLTRWTFSRPVRRNGALVAAANYRTAPALTILSISPGPGTSPSYVDVTHTEMRTGQAYTPFVDRVEAD